MKMKDRIKQLEEKVDWLIKNGNYEKTTVMVGFNWGCTRYYVKYIYDGEIKVSDHFYGYLYIVKDNKDTCLLRESESTYYLLDKAKNTITRLPNDYKPKLEKFSGSSFMIDGKRLNCKFTREKQSEKPLVYSLQVDVAKKDLGKVFSVSSIHIKFDDKSKTIEFFCPTNEQEKILSQKDNERIAFELISTGNDE